MIVTPETGVAAASCFKYNGDEIDESRYSIMVGNGGIDKQNVTASKIIPHPDYDSDTFANNLAVIKFSKLSINNEAGFQVGDLPSEWPNFYYVHHTLQADHATWNEPNVAQDGLADFDACGAASPLFKANNFDFICNSAVRRSFSDENCVLPYKFVVGYNSEKQAQLGFYSHSAIDGDNDFCNGDSQNTIYNYYILLANYIPWINSNIDSVLPTYHADTDNFKSSTGSYKMDTSFEYTGNEPRLYSLYELNKALEGNPESADTEQDDSSDGQENGPQENDPQESDPQENDSPENEDEELKTTTVYITKYKTKYETTTTTEYEDTTTTTVDGNLSTTTTTTTEHDSTTIWTTETDKITELTTTTTTIHDDAFTIVYSTKTETVTEAEISIETSISTSVLTVTVADIEECPATSYCDTSYIGPGEVITTTLTVTESFSTNEGTVTVTETVDATDDGYSVSSFVAVTVTVANTTIYDTIAVTTVVETETVTEDISDMLSGLESESISESGGSEGNTNSEDSTDDGIISLTPPGNDEESDEGSSENESSDSNDTQQQTGQSSSGGLSIAAIIGIVVAVLVILAGIGFFVFKWWKKRNADASADADNTTPVYPSQPAYNLNYNQG
ncbi:hypothetical protein IWW36_003004, partial [Coemansia brasiliensis]